mmetsp:Transcript_13481/g.30895  ORF Transcript_13481/g.30895 Transcript_13481/m.30895 type:complete len:252 (+) Transcript_13481:1137-1892(+)
MSSPVLIFTGHFSWHMPSAAHVCSPLYVQFVSNSRSRCASSTVSSEASMARSRLISRYTVMRCRGVRLRSRDGQLDSQNPHSMHRSTMASAGGDALSAFLCTSSSSLRITPGLRIPWGSKRRFSSHIRLYALDPHSISTNGATLRPVLCSALSDPPYLSATISHSSCIIWLYRSISSSFRNPWEKTRCRFPSSAWPKHDASWYLCRLNISMRSSIMSPSLSTSHATSSMSIDVPVSLAAPTMGMRPLRTSQ